MEQTILTQQQLKDLHWTNVELGTQIRVEGICPTAGCGTILREKAYKNESPVVSARLVGVGGNNTNNNNNKVQIKTIYIPCKKCNKIIVYKLPNKKREEQPERI